MHRSSATLKKERNEKPLVMIVDDDEGVTRALARLFDSVDLRSCSFRSPAEMLNAEVPDCLKCLVLDVRLPGVSGIDFQSKLTSLGMNLQVIFMTGYGDIAMTVQAMKGGAVDFLTKPFRDQDMLDAVMVALGRDQCRREENAEREAIVAEYASLSPREREVMLHVCRGLMNKQSAELLGLSEITVKVHRGSVMRKMYVRSVADLVRKAVVLGLYAGD